MTLLKKTAVALAAFGALTGVAHAQSNVTLYGLVDLYVGKNTTKTTVAGVSTRTGPGTSLMSGGLNGSRWGLRGTEDLGGGLKATFQLESGFNADTGTSAVAGGGFNRTSKVGLSGGFGSFEMGRQYTQMFLLMDRFDAQGTSSFSATNAIFGPAPAGALPGTTPAAVGALSPALRRDNMLQYTTPNMGGFTGALQYAFGENGGPGVSAGRTMGLSALYEGGPVAVQGVYEAVKSAGPAATTAKSTGLGVSYDFTAVKVLAQFVNQKNGLANGFKDSGVVLSVAVPVGSAGSLNAGIGSEKTKAVATGLRVGKTSSASVEYRHDLSKRTTVYAGLTNVKFERESAPVSTLKDQTYGVGLRHRF
jgi:predicted porin